MRRPTDAHDRLHPRATVRDTDDSGLRVRRVALVVLVTLLPLLVPRLTALASNSHDYVRDPLVRRRLREILRALTEWDTVPVVAPGVAGDSPVTIDRVGGNNDHILMSNAHLPALWMRQAAIEVQD